MIPFSELKINPLDQCLFRLELKLKDNAGKQFIEILNAIQ